MTAYVIVDQHTVDDGDEARASVAEYRAATGPTLEPYGGRYIARGSAITTIEGDWTPERIVLIEFPDVESAKAWYDSPAYQRIIPLRHRSSAAGIIIVDGV